MALKDPEARKAYAAAWREKNREKNREYQRKHREANPTLHWQYQLRDKYDLTLDQYHEVEASQNFRCAICDTDEPGGRGRWHVDHNHRTGKVRGLLCQACNLMLGHGRDSTRILTRGIEYLERHGD